MKKLVSLFIAARLYLLAIPYAVFGVGAAMNQAVLVANGGKFPVMVNDMSAIAFGFGDNGFSDKIHYRMSDETKLNWLADYINLQTAILSPGDLLIELGELLSRFSTVIWMTLVIEDFSKNERR